MITITDQINLPSILTLDPREANVIIVGGNVIVETIPEYMLRVDINSRYKGLEVLMSAPSGTYSIANYLYKVSLGDITTAKYKFTNTTDLGLTLVTSSVSVVNDLISGGASDSLSAEQGVVLKHLVDSIESDLASKVLTNVPLGAVFTDTIYDDTALVQAVNINTAKRSYPSVDETKLWGIEVNANNYSHPSGDGNLHIPATGTTNNGKVLTAGATAGSFSWATPSSAISSHFQLNDIGINTHANIDNHIGNITNPHLVTKTQVGLSAVNNTSDINKPISAATQSALNTKVEIGQPEVNYQTIGNDLKQKITVDEGAWDFSAAGIIESNIASNTIVTFANLQLNKTLKAKLVISSSATLTLPSYCAHVEGSINPSGLDGTYYAYFDCWSDTVNSELVLVSIIQIIN